MSDENTKIINKFNVKIDGGMAESYEVGAEAKNVNFSNSATSPFNDTAVEDNVPVEIVKKAENSIYGNAYIKNNDNDIEGRPEGFGPIDDIIINRRVVDYPGAGAMSITYGFNSLSTGHHSIATGFDCESKGWASHAEGWKTNTGDSSNCAHAEGAATNALHNIAHAEGDGTIAAGYSSHAEGDGTKVYAVSSHAEGSGSIIGEEASIAWQNSNALHQGTTSDDNDVALEKKYPKEYINGQFSHAEGVGNTIYGSCCHAEGIGNTIQHKTYGSTVMGENNHIYSNTSLVVGTDNVLGQGADNSLMLGLHNENGGYPNSLFLGQYSKMDEEQSEVPALVIGSGDSTTASNLMTIRHPQTGVASPTNKGRLWGEHLDASFGTLRTPDLKGLKVVTFSTTITGASSTKGAQFIFNGDQPSGQAYNEEIGVSKQMKIRYYYYPALGYLMVYMFPFAINNAGGVIHTSYPAAVRNSQWVRYDGVIGQSSSDPHPFQTNMPADLKKFIIGVPSQDIPSSIYEKHATSLCVHEGGGLSTAYLNIESMVRNSVFDLDNLGNQTQRHCFQIRHIGAIPIISNNFNYQPWFIFHFHGTPVQE